MTRTELLKEDFLLDFRHLNILLLLVVDEVIFKRLFSCFNFVLEVSSRELYSNKRCFTRPSLLTTRSAPVLKVGVLYVWKMA